MRQLPFMHARAIRSRIPTQNGLAIGREREQANAAAAVPWEERRRTVRHNKAGEQVSPHRSRSRGRSGGIWPATLPLS